MVDVEKEHVHRVYSKIAAHFSDTRFKAWPQVAQFLQGQPPGSIIADVGCGNGKYLGVNSQVFMLGSDICPELVAIGCSRGHEVLTCDCLHLPYKEGVFDGVICIAVIHHLSSETRRLDSLLEMARILRPGGKMLVYVWAMEQERKKFDGQDVMVPWHLQPKYSAGEESCHGERASKAKAEAKAERARAKKLEKKRRKVKEKGCIEGEVPCGALESAALYQDIRGEVQELGSCVSSEGEPDQQPTDSTSQQQQLAREGYTTYQRYYHVFKQGELVELFHRVPQLHVKEEFYDHDNWCVLAEKL